jgi:two-component system, chemotaxis family, response regulator Rcp1
VARNHGLGYFSMASDVLLVEDNPGDVRLTREAFREVDSSVTVHAALDGESALAFLRREGIYADEPRPALILLDLNIPKMNGHAVLKEIKGDPDLRIIPTIILTTSAHPADIAVTYGLHANCYLHKPRLWDDFVALIVDVDRFWLKNINMVTQHDVVLKSNDQL